jgi:hypothetical protein
MCDMSRYAEPAAGGLWLSLACSHLLSLPTPDLGSPLLALTSSSRFPSPHPAFPCLLSPSLPLPAIFPLPPSVCSPVNPDDSPTRAVFPPPSISWVCCTADCERHELESQGGTDSSTGPLSRFQPPGERERERERGSVFVRSWAGTGARRQVRGGRAGAGPLLPDVDDPEVGLC